MTTWRLQESLMIWVPVSKEEKRCWKMKKKAGRVQKHCPLCTYSVCDCCYDQSIWHKKGSLGFLQNLLFLISSANRGAVIACWFQIGSWGDCALHMCNSQKYLKKKIVLTENSHLANTYVCGYCVIILVEGGGIGVVQMQRESESSCIDWWKSTLNVCTSNL